ncbi:extracellular metalloprotease-like [Oculina patagonica]
MGCAASSSPRTTVQGCSLPKDVSGRDELRTMTSPPYKWICYLTIHRSSGDYVGTGFKIHLPDVHRTAIVTSGHVTYSRMDKEFANSITVKFPGQAPIEVKSKDIYAAPEYIDSGNTDYDYGLILLPGAGNSNDGFSWSAIVPDEELNNLVVTSCGYPADKRPRGTMWITGGKITKITANRISYMDDTAGGQSGSPVYTWYDGYWTVLGVHQGATLHPGTTDGECPNYAVRFTVQMIYRFLEFMKEQNSILNALNLLNSAMSTFVVTEQE